MCRICPEALKEVIRKQTSCKRGHVSAAVNQCRSSAAPSQREHNSNGNTAVFISWVNVRCVCALTIVVDSGITMETFYHEDVKKNTKKTEVTQRNITDCYTQTNYGVNRCLTHAKIVPQTCQNIVVLLLPHCRGDFKACPQKKKKKNWFCSHAKNMFPSSVPEVNMAETEVEKIPEKPHVLR